MKKLMFVLLVATCAGCASAPSAASKERDEFIALAQKYGYCGHIGYLSRDVNEEMKEYFRKLNTMEATPFEHDGWKICYDPNKNLGWENFFRYNYVKWSNENLAKWGRGFNQQLAYHKEFKPTSLCGLDFEERYVIGYANIEDVAGDETDDDYMIICLANQASRLGAVKRAGEVKFTKPILGFSRANISLNEDGKISSVEMHRKFAANISDESVLSASKAIWKTLEEMYKIKATRIWMNGYGSWHFENDNCKIDLYGMNKEIIFKMFLHRR